MKRAIAKTILGVSIVCITGWSIYKLFNSSVDFHEVILQLKSFSWVEVILLMGFSSAMMVVRAYRFHLLLEDAGQELAFWQTLKVFMTGQAFSPLPAGEGLRPVLLQKEANIAVKESITPVIMLGVSEMLVAVLIAIIGSIFLGILRAAAVIAAIALLGIVWLLINQKIVVAAISKLPSHPKIKKAATTVVDTQKEIRLAIFHRHSWYPSNAFLITCILALCTSLLGAEILLLIGRHFQLALGFWQSLYIFAATTVLGELVPFAPGGIGPTEGGMTGILLALGVSLGPALVVVLLFRTVTLVYGVLLGAIFLTIFYAKEYAIKLTRAWQ